MEPSLQDIQRTLDQWSQDQREGECALSRSDGEILALSCTSTIATGNGSVRAGPSEVFSFQRVADAYKRLKLPAMLPAAGADPRPTLARYCAGTALSAIDAVPLEELTPGDPWINSVEATRDAFVVGVGWRSEPGGYAACAVPWPRIGAALGCGPLAHLPRPGLLDPSALARHEAVPLEVVRIEVSTASGGDWHYPWFRSRDPRRAAIAQSINSAIAEWWARQATGAYFNVQCDPTLSSSTLVSVLCRAGEGSGASTQEGFTYRLSDGSRITATALIGQSQGLLDRVAQKCLGRLVHKPTSDYDEVLSSLPKLDPRQLGIGLELASVRVVVGYEAKAAYQPKPVAHEAVCWLSYKDLGTTVRALAAPPTR